MIASSSNFIYSVDFAIFADIRNKAFPRLDRKSVVLGKSVG